MASTFKYIIGLSYENKDVRFITEVTKALEKELGPQTVFFDRKQSSAVKGQNRLNEIFSSECEFVVPFWSSKYKLSPHCQNEWAAIQPRLTTTPPQGIIVKIDHSEIPGWRDTDVTISRERRKTGKVVAAEIIEFYNRCKKQQGNGRDANLVYGFIVVADVSDFSNLPSESFREVIEQMWAIPESIGLLDSNHNPRPLSLLDGMIITLSQNIDHDRLLELCERWIADLKKATRTLNNGRGVELRLALHHGGYYEHTKRGNIVGVAVNECSRLVRMAPAGVIVVSESFVRTWTEPKGLRPPRDDSEDDKPIGLRIKSKNISLFRYFRYPSDAPFPEILRNAHDAEKLLFVALEAIEDEFVDLVVEKSKRILSPAKIAARVSIFVMDQFGTNGCELRSTEFRFMRPVARKKKSAYLSEGQTTYLAASGIAEGSQGRAFVERCVQVDNDLPAYKDDPDGYAERLAKWDIPARKVHHFSKHARCFVAIPFWMHKGCTESEGVICIDTDEPLSDIPTEFLKDCAHQIGVFYGPLISSLIRLRS